MMADGTITLYVKEYHLTTPIPPKAEHATSSVAQRRFVSAVNVFGYALTADGRFVLTTCSLEHRCIFAPVAEDVLAQKVKAAVEHSLKANVPDLPKIVSGARQPYHQPVPLVVAPMTSFDDQCALRDVVARCTTQHAKTIQEYFRDGQLALWLFAPHKARAVPDYRKEEIRRKRISAEFHLERCPACKTSTELFLARNRKASCFSLRGYIG